VWKYGIAFRHEQNSDEVHHLVLCQGSFDDTIETINSTLFGLTETEGAPFERFLSSFDSC
jgi:hypothetical protein